MSLETDIRLMIESQGLTLYDTQTSNSPEASGMKTFEILLQGKNGVSLEQCAEVSRLLSPLFDVTPPVSGEYRLEVGTPGIERKLKTVEHFEHSIDELVKVTLITGELFQGKLLKIEDKNITIETKNGEEVVDFAEVLKARTYFEW